MDWNRTCNSDTQHSNHGKKLGQGSPGFSQTSTISSVAGCSAGACEVIKYMLENVGLGSGRTSFESSLSFGRLLVDIGSIVVSQPNCSYTSSMQEDFSLPLKIATSQNEASLRGGS